MPIARHAPCPCGSGRKGLRCCGPLLDGAPAPTPEALMRSRYAAYALGDVGHVMRTTAPDSPHFDANARRWRADLTEYCRRVRFEGLEVREASEHGDEGRVRFFARLSVEGRDVSFGEDSRFARRGGRWWYVDGRPDP